MKNKGLIHIYTGEGKGKTTAAVGLSVRALGNDMKVCYSFFHKRPEKYGYSEIANIEKLGADIFAFSKGHPGLDKAIKAEQMQKEAPEALVFLSKLIKEKNYDMLVMDEVLISVRDNYITESQLSDFINNKPEHMELVLTGRGATQSIIDLADYVSEIKPIKHPFTDNGIIARKGIEF